MSAVRLCLTLLMFIPSLSFASPLGQEQGPSIKELVKKFYIDKAVKEFKSSSALFSSSFQLQHRENQCGDRPTPTSCIDSICKRIPSYDCDSTSDIREVGETCRSADGSCIDEVCSKLPSYECNSLSDFDEIADVCQDSRGSCITSVCSRIPSYECDSLSDLEEIGQMCRGMRDNGCVEAICSRLPSYRCDSTSDLEDVIDECSRL